MSTPGMGYMISALRGNGSSVDTFQSAVNKTIASIALDPEYNGGDGGLRIAFTDLSGIVLFDDARSCCENRYMHTDEDLQSFIGAQLVGAETRDAPDREDEHGEYHEVQFLLVHTDLGTFTLETHNEHNGYYGGFSLQCNKLQGVS